MEIAALPRFSPIPFGTLASIYAGRIRLPKKYWKQQNIKSERRIKYPTIEIRRDDPASAAQTLRNAFDKGLITQEYIDRLFDELYIQFPDPCELTTFEELFARKEAQNVDLHATI